MGHDPSGMGHDHAAMGHGASGMGHDHAAMGHGAGPQTAAHGTGGHGMAVSGAPRDQWRPPGPVVEFGCQFLVWRAKLFESG